MTSGWVWSRNENESKWSLSPAKTASKERRKLLVNFIFNESRGYDGDLKLQVEIKKTNKKKHLWSQDGALQQLVWFISPRSCSLPKKDAHHGMAEFSDFTPQVCFFWNQPMTRPPVDVVGSEHRKKKEGMPLRQERDNVRTFVSSTCNQHLNYTLVWLYGHLDRERSILLLCI